MTTESINELRKEIEKAGEVTFERVTSISAAHTIVKIDVDELMQLIEDHFRKDSLK